MVERAEPPILGEGFLGECLVGRQQFKVSPPQSGSAKSFGAQASRSLISIRPLPTAQSKI